MRGMIVEITNKGYQCLMIWHVIIEDRKTRVVGVEGRLKAEKNMRDILTCDVLPL